MAGRNQLPSCMDLDRDEYTDLCNTYSGCNVHVVSDAVCQPVSMWSKVAGWLGYKYDSNVRAVDSVSDVSVAVACDDASVSGQAVDGVDDIAAECVVFEGVSVNVLHLFHMCWDCQLPRTFEAIVGVSLKVWAPYEQWQLSTSKYKRWCKAEAKQNLVQSSKDVWCDLLGVKAFILVVKTHRKLFLMTSTQATCLPTSITPTHAYPVCTSPVAMTVAVALSVPMLFQPVAVSVSLVSCVPLLEHSVVVSICPVVNVPVLEQPAAITVCSVHSVLAQCALAAISLSPVLSMPNLDMPVAISVCPAVCVPVFVYPLAIIVCFTVNVPVFASPVTICVSLDPVSCMSVLEQSVVVLKCPSTGMPVFSANAVNRVSRCLICNLPVTVQSGVLLCFGACMSNNSCCSCKRFKCLLIRSVYLFSHCFTVHALCKQQCMVFMQAQSARPVVCRAPLSTSRAFLMYQLIISPWIHPTEVLQLGDSKSTLSITCSLPSCFLQHNISFDPGGCYFNVGCVVGGESGGRNSEIVHEHNLG
eukprot:TRINITY_DN1727_c0_g1_i14.p1 TRINITY_DN1727_c0_g1~~TRINITY_DN1727_c0_g1_i14.p1  ORF type:complete len:529 (-),score=30.15 TRINITY_DN1727_c0_g1_i14:117-1703(-)